MTFRPKLDSENPVNSIPSEKIDAFSGYYTYQPHPMAIGMKGAMASSFPGKPRNTLPFRLNQAGLFQRGTDKPGEERMGIEGARFQFRVELDADKPWMIRTFDNFRKQAIR